MASKYVSHGAARSYIIALPAGASVNMPTVQQAVGCSSTTARRALDYCAGRGYIVSDVPSVPVGRRVYRRTSTSGNTSSSQGAQMIVATVPKGPANRWLTKLRRVYEDTGEMAFLQYVRIELTYATKMMSRDHKALVNEVHDIVVAAKQVLEENRNG